MIYSRDTIERALKLTDVDGVAAQQKMTPRPRGVRPAELAGRPRQGGVLVILYEKNGATHLVLTRRRDDLNSHAGQISFPGGRREDGETMQMTALREAHEEVGVTPAALSVFRTPTWASPRAPPAPSAMPTVRGRPRGVSAAPMVRIVVIRPAGG